MSLSLFNDAGPTQPRQPPAAAQQVSPSTPEYAEDVDPRLAEDAYFDMMARWFAGPPSPQRPELESARYWYERKCAAGTPERKAECHRYMILSLLALLDRGQGRQP